MGIARIWVTWSLLLLLTSGFGWPNRARRLVAELHGDADAERRVDLVRLLASLATDEAREALVDACSDPQPGVRAAALQGLGRSPEPPLDVMRSMLADAAPAVRAAAAGALGAARDGESLERLMRALSDEDPAVRAESARALGRLRLGKASGPLAAALTDGDSEVVRASAEALAIIAGSEAEALIASRYSLLPIAAQRQVLEALIAAPSALARRPALQALVSEHPAIVRAGLQLVQRHGLSEALPQVDALRTRAEEHVARTAQLTFSVLSTRERSPGLRPWLPALLDAGDPQLAPDRVEQTLGALERLVPDGARLAADPLAEWLVRAPDEVKARIASLLARTRAAVPAGPLLPLLRHRDGRLRAALCTVLAQTGQPTVAVALLPLLQDRVPAVRAAAARAVGALADTELALAMGARLEDLSPAQRGSTAEALARSAARLAHGWGENAREQIREAALAGLASVDEPTAAQLVRCLGAVDAAAATKLLRVDGPSLRSVRRVALLRASAADRGPEARALRAQYSKSRDPALAATALAARLLADEPASPEQLLELLVGQRWPVGPLASFGLTRSSPSALDLQRAALCTASRLAREPTTARNLRVALEKIRDRCPASEGSEPASRTAAQRPANEMQVAATFVVLELPDQSALVSVRDAAGDASWPMLAHVSEQSAWHLPYRANR